MKYYYLRNRLNIKVHNFWLNLATKLPKKLQLWCFVLVYGADMEAPSSEYKTKYEYFKNKYNIKGM